MLSSPLAGVNGVYVARMDYQDIDQRKAYSGTEMFWAPSPSQPMQGGVLGFLPFWYYGAFLARAASAPRKCSAARPASAPLRAPLPLTPSNKPRPPQKRSAQRL
jgi:hypothetical protein